MTATEIEIVVVMTVIMIVVQIVLVKAIVFNLVLVKKMNEGSNSTVSSISPSTATNHNNLY